MSHVYPFPSALIHLLPSSPSLLTPARDEVDTLKGQLRVVKSALDKERAASTIMAWLRHINVQRAEVAAVALARERRRAAKLAKKMRKKRRKAERLSSADGDDDVSDSTSSSSLSSSASCSSSDDDSSSSSSSPDAGDRVIRKLSANLKVEIPGARGAAMPLAGGSTDSPSGEQVHTRLKSPPILRPASMNSEGKWDVGSLRSPPAVGTSRRVVSFASKVKVIGAGSTDRKRHRRRKKHKDKRDKADRKDKKARKKHKQASDGSPDGKSGSKHEDDSTSNDDRGGGTTQGNQSDISPPSSPKIGGVSRVVSSTNKTTNKIKETRVNVDLASIEAATLIQRIYRRYFFMSAIRKFASTSLRIKKKSEAAYNRNRLESAVLMLQRMVRGLIAREKVRGT